MAILFSDDIEEVEDEDNCDSFEFELFRSSDEDELEPDETGCPVEGLLVDVAFCRFVERRV